MCIKIKKNKLFFYISFFLLYISGFLGDIGSDVIDFSQVAKYFRMASYAVMVLQFININRKKKEYKKFLVIILISILLYFTSKDLYFCIMALMIMNSLDCIPEQIIKESLCIMLSGIISVLVLCAIRALPDVMTSRTGVGQFDRHSFGFVHSDVLPVIILYSEIYYIILKNKKVKNIELLIFLGIQSILYIFCDSRNGFYMGILLVVLVLFEKNIGITKFIKRVITFFSQYEVLILGALSYTMIYLLESGGIWDKIDSLFSGRFRGAIFKARVIGINIISKITYDEFMADDRVLDNGYLYIMLRYGILILAVFIFINYFYVKRYKENFYAIIAIFVVLLANFVDNDLTDYSFLPFIILVFNRHKLGESP